MRHSGLDGLAKASRPAGFSSTGVRAHYAELAETYEDKANQVCKFAYQTLIRSRLAGANSVLEFGCGSSSLLACLNAPFKLASDHSLPMLHAGPPPLATLQLACDATSLPCRSETFDGAFCINLLEHVPDPRSLLSEAHRVLKPSGCFVAVTPNGNLEPLLDVLERVHLKLPEGPHRFLKYEELESLAGEFFRIREHRRFLAFPAGTEAFASTIDRILGGRAGRGLFQYVVLSKEA